MEKSERRHSIQGQLQKAVLDSIKPLKVEELIHMDENGNEISFANDYKEQYDASEETTTNEIDVLMVNEYKVL